jgi:hypothetical protein
MDQSDPKALNLINKIWNGPHATKCDGNIYGYSRMMHILFNAPKKVTKSDTTYFEIATNRFIP